MANFDIILRWTTLRFFDTNTSVMLKCLEFLQSLFANLVTADYRMSDYEAYAFIPYLVLKVCMYVHNAVCIVRMCAFLNVGKLLKKKIELLHCWAQ